MHQYQPPPRANPLRLGIQQFRFNFTGSRIFGALMRRAGALTGPGELVGEMEVMSGQARTFTVEAVRDTQPFGQPPEHLLGISSHHGRRRSREITPLCGTPFLPVAFSISQIIRSRWLRRRSARYQCQITWARKLLSMAPRQSAGTGTRAFGGNLAVMDIYAARKVFGRGRRVRPRRGGGWNRGLRLGS